MTLTNKSPDVDRHVSAQFGPTQSRIDRVDDNTLILDEFADASADPDIQKLSDVVSIGFPEATLVVQDFQRMCIFAFGKFREEMRIGCDDCEVCEGTRIQRQEERLRLANLRGLRFLSATLDVLRSNGSSRRAR